MYYVSAEGCNMSSRGRPIKLRSSKSFTRILEKCHISLVECSFLKE